MEGSFTLSASSISLPNRYRTDVIERGTVAHTVGKHNACCSLVIGFCDGTESLLACCIPELEFDSLVSDGDSLSLEVDPYGGDIVVLECLVAEARLRGCVPKDEVGLTDSSVADDNDLEDVIVGISVHGWMRNSLGLKL